MRRIFYKLQIQKKNNIFRKFKIIGNDEINSRWKDLESLSIVRPFANLSEVDGNIIITKSKVKGDDALW